MSKDLREMNFNKITYERDDKEGTIWIKRETGGPEPDPVVQDKDAKQTVGMKREDTPFPSTFFTAGSQPEASNLFMGIKGPLRTTGGVYWASQGNETMKCPPPKSANLPFPVGGIWVHDVKKGRNQEAVRQAFVYNAEDLWLIVPGGVLEAEEASFPHPAHADRWFSMAANGTPKWLKADTLAKYKRAKRRAQAFGQLEGIPTSVADAVDHRVSLTVEVDNTIGKSAARLRPTPYRVNRPTRANPNGDRNAKSTTVRFPETISEPSA
ncbi:hypothetical protein PQX77_001408 [Marasmius sp. AFHP31]|nr:hypothetical protein PQX77_001408 [Marasmius sp. AFHP31]